MFQNIGHVISVNDVFTDAHNTFLTDNEVQQTLECVEHDNAFNWNEEDDK